MTNHEVALVWLADVLARLQQNWPKPIDLSMDDVVKATNTSPPEDDEDGDLWFYLGAWLTDEGFIRSSDGVLGSVDITDAVLTARGFKLVGKPIPGEKKQSVGSRLRDLAGEAAKETVKTGAKHAAGEISDLLNSALGGLFT